MTARIIAAGIAVAVIVVGWQVGGGLRSVITHLKPSGGTASTSHTVRTTAATALPIISLKLNGQPFTCHLTPPRAYSCSAPSLLMVSR